MGLPFSGHPAAPQVNDGLISVPLLGWQSGMEIYNIPEQGHAYAYVSQGVEQYPQFTGPLLEQLEAMYNEGPQEFADQGVYYPTATNYGYICTGFESPSDWDDHHRVFGLDGQEVQYAVSSECLPYVYYNPNYGYAQSPYNPYNPYIPGAMIGVDNPFLGTQQYYAISAYENPVSATPYYPTNTADLQTDSAAYSGTRAVAVGLKHNTSSVSPAIPSLQSNSFTRLSEGSRTSAGSSKQAMAHRSVSSDSFSRTNTSQIVQGKGAHVSENLTRQKALSDHSQLRVSLPSANSLASFGSTGHSRAMLEKVQFPNSRELDEIKVSPDALTEPNRGPRTNKFRNQFVVKAYTARAGNVDAQGHIIIHTDEYNKDDFVVDYLSAKFFVIKSYSEDDVHKSIKYNVWSSTPNGNKKLNSAYEDAQRTAAGDPRGCPIFLFFSVNASGQFCGVAEMTGPVDFHRDMDFWQQDKWSGSFPVKWHIVKDVPNPNFRHILLENNENKPVTNSRDTQEVRYSRGIEMLRIFKNYSSKTSLLDDFMYYETRQKILQEEKAKLLIKSNESPLLASASDSPRKLSTALGFPSSEGEKIGKDDGGLRRSEIAKPAHVKHVSSDAEVAKLKVPDDGGKLTKDEEVYPEDALKISSLNLNSEQTESKGLGSVAGEFSCSATTQSIDVVTVGSMPVKVNGFTDTSSFLTFGTVPLVSRALPSDEGNMPGNGASGNLIR